MSIDSLSRRLHRATYVSATCIIVGAKLWILRRENSGASVRRCTRHLLVLGGEQAVAQPFRDDAPLQRVLAVVRGVVEQHSLDGTGITDGDGAAERKALRDHELLEERRGPGLERIVAQCPDEADKTEALLARDWGRGPETPRADCVQHECGARQIETLTPRTGRETRARGLGSPVYLPSISLSHGARWNALISRYIGTIPLSGGVPCNVAHKASGWPPTRPVSSAMMANVGAAARLSQSAAPSAAGREAPAPTILGSMVLVLTVCTRRGASTRRLPSRCGPWGRGRATDRRPRCRRRRAHRSNRCGRRRRPRARTRSCRAARAGRWRDPCRT